MSPLLQKRAYNFDRVFRLAVSLALTVAIIWIIKSLSAVLLPFAIGFLGAYLLHPAVTYLQRYTKNRLLAIVVIFIGMGLLLLIAAAVVVPQVGKQMNDLARIISTVIGDGSVPSTLKGYINPEIWQALAKPLTQENVLTTLQSQQVWHTAWSLLQKLAPGVLNVFSGLVAAIGSLLSLGLTMLYLIFILQDFATVQQEVTEILPPPWRRPLLEFTKDINTAMSVYFRNRFLIALIQGLIFALGLSLIGIPMSIVLGFSIGLASMVPYAQLLGLVPVLLFGTLNALDAGSSLLVMAAAVALLFGLVQLLDDAVLTPRLMGKATGLSPAVILLAISIWGKVLGLLGLIIAIPITCVLLAWYKRLNRVQ